MMPRPLRAVIADDEPLARERLRTLLEMQENVVLEVVAEAAGGAVAIEQIGRLVPDVIFLDINMPHVDGFDVAAHIYPREKPLIVFVTAYDTFALRAFELSAVDYLLKPIDSPRLQRALEKVERRFASATALTESRQLEKLIESINGSDAPRDRLAVRTGQNYLIVRLADVIWVEADGNYIILNTETTSYRHRATLSELEPLLNANGFMRIHRSTILNARRVTVIEPWGLGEFLFTLSNGKKLASTRRYRRAIRDVFGV